MQVINISQVHDLVHALQSSHFNAGIQDTPHLSFDLERDLLLRFSFLSLSLSLSLCRSLSRLHGSGAMHHANITGFETLSASRGEDVQRGGAGAHLS